MSAAFVALSRFTEGHRSEVRVESADGEEGGVVFRVLLPKGAAPVRVEAAR